jgi:membrane protein
MEPGETSASRRALRSALDHGKELKNEVRDDGLVDAAAGVAFWLLLSIPAAALALISALSFIGDGLTSNLHDTVDRFIDETFASQADSLKETVDELFSGPRAGLFSTSIAIALFTVSRGFAGLIRALDNAYDIDEQRGAVRLRLTAFALALGTFVTVAVSFYGWVQLRDAGLPFVLRGLLALVVLVMWSAAMFHMGPHHRTPWRYDVPGALIAAVGWLVLTVGFSFYVRIAGTGNQVVGLTGGLLVGLTWLWLACLVFLVGAEVNEIIADRADAIRAPRNYDHLVSWQAIKHRVSSVVGDDQR